MSRSSRREVLNPVRGQGTPAHVIGRNEWVALPGLGIPGVDAKIDTGATSSVLHAVGIEVRGGRRPKVEFLCHPLPDREDVVVRCVCPLADMRDVRSSNGEVERRVFIRQDLVAGRFGWKIEISLTGRQQMRHRMLIGQSALAGRFLVDPGRAYLLGGVPPDSLYEAITIEP